MYCIYLTHAEAADAAVIANIARHLFGHEPTIAHEDRPDTGREVGATAAPFAPPAPAATDPATVFGTVGAVAPTTALATPAPPIAAVSTPAPAAAFVASPAPSAPVPPASPAPVATSGSPALDSRGLPWDVRIHAGSKTFNKDGSWRQKRETPPELVAQVEAELKALMGIQAPAAAPAPVAPPLPPSSVFAVGAAAAGAPIPPGAQAIPTPPPAVEGAIVKFSDLMLWLNPLMMAGKITQNAMVATLVGLGLPPGNPLGGLAMRVDLVPAAHKALVALLPA